MAAELWGLHDGLTLARNLNIRKLLVEVDASVMANFFPLLILCMTPLTLLVPS